MRRPLTLIVAVMAPWLMLAGCGSNRTTSETSSDSLLSANPQETGSGSLTPQTDYNPPAKNTPSRPRSNPPAASRPGITVPSGTPIAISVNTQISSETAQAGETWSGTVDRSIVIDGRTVIPAGSVATGTISAAKPAVKGDRAMLDLALTSIAVDGRTYRLHGGTEAIIAGSPRARNLGAIAGGAAAGALIGKAVSGTGKGAAIGGLIGGATATGVVAKSKGYQVVLKPGTSLTFTTNEPVAVRE